MKIYFIGNEFTGLYNNRKELIEQLIRNGEEVYFSVNENSRNNELVDMGCIYKNLTIPRKSKNPLKDIGLFLKLLKNIKEVKPDIIMLYNIKPVLYGSTIGRIKSIPTIATITGLGKASQNSNSPGERFFSKLILIMYKFALKKTESIFFQNKYDLEIFKNNKINELKKYTLVTGSGVNVEYFNYSKSFKPNRIKTFLFIGRFIRTKGIMEYIETAIKIKQQGYNVKFQLLGKFEEQEEINNLIKELEAEGTIEYLGYSDDVRKEISKADCVVLPSYTEGMSNVLLQAAAMKRVLIASNIPGCKEIVEHNLNGYLCEPRSTDSLVKAINSLINQGDNDWANMSENSRRIVVEKFDKRHVVDSYLKKIYSLGEK
ncbi:glycosyltransferase family 4 protein [Calidifontibacillus oryziterrae]|uniref:glycosyltransferase family 4 protein n=1 Tax=Calidifontibacillus oryziterrae TaxID=1191699 RepID=UPI000310AEEB|nr:glycosyltransferase family 4 protein [Calidifontibacillus oryziterrae]